MPFQLEKREKYVAKRRLAFKRQAEVALTILSLYIHVVSKKQPSLPLLERKGIIDQLLDMLRRVVVAEGSYSLELNLELLAAFMFQK